MSITTKPRSRESEHLAIANLEAEWLLHLAVALPFIEWSAGKRQRWVLIGSRKDDVVVIVSHRALMVLTPMLGSVAQEGIKPYSSVPTRGGSLADDGNWLSRSDVVARNPVILERNCVECSERICLRRESR